MASEVDECEIFINEIRQRTELWDKDNPDIANRSINEAKWEEISKKFGVPVENVKKKWGMLRIQFRRELRKQIAHRLANSESSFPTIQPWKYFIPMLFIKDQVNFVKPIASAGDRQYKLDWENKNSNFDQIMNELQMLEGTYEGPIYDSIPILQNLSKTPKPTLTLSFEDITGERRSANKTETPFTVLLENFQKEIINLEKEKIDKVCMTNKDDDILFLHSILPYFKALEPKKKFILRTKIQQLVCDFVTNVDDKNPTDHSYASSTQFHFQI